MRFTFKCKERRIFCFLLSSIWASKNSVSALLLMVAASIISPACNFSPSFNKVSFPSAELKYVKITFDVFIYYKLSHLKTIFTVSASAMMWDFSLPKKSPWVMWATWVLLSLAQGFIPGDLFTCFLAISLTGLAHLLSEFPSLSTGLTALPRILPYLALTCFSSSVAGLWLKSGT